MGESTRNTIFWIIFSPMLLLLLGLIGKKIFDLVPGEYEGFAYYAGPIGVIVIAWILLIGIPKWFGPRLSKEALELLQYVARSEHKRFHSTKVQGMPGGSSVYCKAKKFCDGTNATECISYKEAIEQLHGHKLLTREYHGRSDYSHTLTSEGIKKGLKLPHVDLIPDGPVFPELEERGVNRIDPNLPIDNSGKPTTGPKRR